MYLVRRGRLDIVVNGAPRRRIEEISGPIAVDLRTRIVPADLIGPGEQGRRVRGPGPELDLTGILGVAGGSRLCNSQVRSDDPRSREKECDIVVSGTPDHLAEGVGGAVR